MQSMYYIGLDVHKRTISYCVKEVSGRIYAEGSYINMLGSFSRIFGRRTTKVYSGLRADSVMQSSTAIKDRRGFVKFVTA